MPELAGWLRRVFTVMGGFMMGTGVLTILVAIRTTGGALFIWQINAPYLFSGALLIALALGIAWKLVGKRRAAAFTV